MVDPRPAIRDENPSPEAPREWLVANGLGGYASATITGEITRRYHGFLIAAQPAPLDRMVVLNDLEVDVERADGSVVNMREQGRFLDFTLNMGLPSWRYELDGIVIEKSIVVPSRQNIVHCTFRSLGDGQPVRLRLRPFINFRPLEAPVADALSSGYSYTLTIQVTDTRSAPGPICRFSGWPSRGPKGRPLPPMAARGASAFTTSRDNAVTIRAAGYGAPATSPGRSARTAR
jgi:Glycogen debranching enzyme N terminal